MKNELINIITDNEATRKFIHSFIRKRIRNIIGDKKFLFSIEDLQINEYPRIEINLLIDKRIIKEGIEFNEQGVHLIHKVDENDILVFDYKLKKYSFSDSGKETIFRVKDTEDTFPCSKCDGKKEIICNRCSGSGKNRCTICKGQGQIKCSICNGRGENTCYSCGGKGVKTEGYGENKRTITCSSCGGRGAKKCTSCSNGWKTCSTCRGKGEITCPNCYGKGCVKCNECQGYGFFNRYLTVVSKIGVEEIHQYLKGNPTLDYVSIKIDNEEYDYSNDLSYHLKVLKDYDINFKSLLARYCDKVNSKAYKISFSKSICYTIEFNVLIGQNKFKFEYLSDDFVTHTNFDSSVFYSIISAIPIEKDFVTLADNKNYLISKVGKPANKIFEQIKEYILLKKIIDSNEKTSIKLNEVRKLKLINVLKYDDFLQNKLTKRYILLSAILVVGTFVGLLFFNGLRFIPLLISIIGMSLGYFLSYKIFRKKIKHSSYVSSFTLSFILLILFSGLTALTGFITIQINSKLAENELIEMENNKRISESINSFNQLKKTGVIVPSDSIILLVRDNLKTFLYDLNLSKTIGYKPPDNVLVLKADSDTKNYVFCIPAGWEHHAYEGYRDNNGSWEPYGEYKIRKSKSDIQVSFGIEDYLKANWNQEITVTFHGIEKTTLPVKKSILNISGILVEYCYLDGNNNLIKDKCWIKIGIYKKYFSNNKLIIYDNLVKNKFQKDVISGLIFPNQRSTKSGTWMVILGSFKNQGEAINTQEQFLTKYQLQTEMLNSNNFQNLTKDLYIIVGGKNLTNGEAKQLLEKIKERNVDGYIKDAGSMN